MLKGSKEVTLSDEAREARNKYYREYRKKNKAKVKQIQQRYWENKIEPLKVGT